jgi:FkbM family methyltransferase
MIGANDGKSMDPIYEFLSNSDVSGLVVEPLPDIFERLKDNYQHIDKIKCVNRAVHSSRKKMTIYRVDPALKDIPEWMHGIGSFDPMHYKKSGTPKEYILEEEVNCSTFMDLLSEYDITKIDLLKIDVEGYDYEVLKMIDFKKIKPEIIRYEHGSLSKTDKTSAERLLTINGYSILVEGNDTSAMLDNEPGWVFDCKK